MRPASERVRVIAVGALPEPSAFAADVRRGLTERPRAIPYRYLYDQEGSRLFERICELAEYYLTRAEDEVLRARSGEIAKLAGGGPVSIVELGCGNAVKTRRILAALARTSDPVHYLPIDVARDTLATTAEGLAREYPRLRVVALAGDYRDGLAAVPRLAVGRRLLLWLGSSIGNLDRDAAAMFLREMAGVMTPDDRLLLGIDRRKDAQVLEAAYDDAEGITERFIKNVLSRINRELGGGFDPDRFEYRAEYREAEGRVEMRLISREAQAIPVRALDLSVEFEPGESLHVEDSYKYSPEEVDDLLARAGLARVRQWSDAADRFQVVLGRLDSSGRR